MIITIAFGFVKRWSVEKYVLIKFDDRFISPSFITPQNRYNLKDNKYTIVLDKYLSATGITVARAMRDDRSRKDNEHLRMGSSGNERA